MIIRFALLISIGIPINQPVRATNAEVIREGLPLIHSAFQVHLQCKSLGRRCLNGGKRDEGQEMLNKMGLHGSV